MTIRVLVVDDHASMRAGLSLVLASDPELEVVGEAGDGEQALQVARRTRPDLVFMDLEMPRTDGVTATAALRRALPDVRILVLTMFDLDDYVARAMEAGAHGFLLKTADARELIAAARACVGGETVLAPAVLARVVGTFVERHSGHASPGLARLTERESEVLRLMCQGLSNAEIAGRLVVEVATVKTHVARILQKLPARDRLQAVVHAFRAGLA
ncbi:response regulator [Ornithinimicrobium tianjinense]|uniref:DNA-binding response regulator n=1 Tax=Ornithinimicrobium tianjinense TaxID=1195761 RepID=A0A917BM11_9MICO|nr:response regulator transcription factor [Ornithinimicrobium tianjinense]GGF46250.1 DNA-binding response regulator [Ornithinimicrobium tianjinense]